MIDIHSHLLPGIDDGPRNWQEAVDLCRAVAADGITTSVATPHLIDGVYENTTSVVAPLVAELNRRLLDCGIELTVLAGAEVDFSSRRALEPDPELPTLGGKGAVLLEMPMAVVPRAIGETIFAIQSSGGVPVIAHPERNEVLQDRVSLAEGWAESGALLQLDGDSLLGIWGERTRACAIALLERGLAHAIASDAHSVRRRPPRLSQAMAEAVRLVGPGASVLADVGPTAILAGGRPERPSFEVNLQLARRTVSEQTLTLGGGRGRLLRRIMGSFGRLGRAKRRAEKSLQRNVVDP